MKKSFDKFFSARANNLDLNIVNLKWIFYDNINILIIG